MVATRAGCSAAWPWRWLRAGRLALWPAGRASAPPRSRSSSPPPSQTGASPFPGTSPPPPAAPEAPFEMAVHPDRGSALELAERKRPLLGSEKAQERDVGEHEAVAEEALTGTRRLSEQPQAARDAARAENAAARHDAMAALGSGIERQPRGAARADRRGPRGRRSRSVGLAWRSSGPSGTRSASNSPPTRPFRPPWFMPRAPAAIRDRLLPYPGSTALRAGPGVSPGLGRGPGS